MDASLLFTSMLPVDSQTKQHGRPAAPTILPRRASTTPPQQQRHDDNSGEKDSIRRAGGRELARYQLRGQRRFSEQGHRAPTDAYLQRFVGGGVSRPCGKDDQRAAKG